MTEEEAKKCVRDAIASGILSDGYSGSQVDLVIITKDKTEYLREYDVVCDKGKRIGTYGFKPGTTPVVTKQVILKSWMGTNFLMISWVLERILLEHKKSVSYFF